MEAEAQQVTAEKPNGPVAAVLFAAGIAVLVLGLLTTIGAASEGFGDWLNFIDRVGPLSGKTLISTATFLVVWPVLGFALRDRDLEWKPVVTLTVVLLAVGFLGTFPTFFEAFEE